MPESTVQCEKCHAPILGGEIGLCPACTMKMVFKTTPQPPTEILLSGKYQLGPLLGEGGFGSVYRAKQTEPIHREVAIKIIKRGMNSAEVTARFDAERQALALLDHPGIAKIYDAGETSEGLPFFAMELVEGQPITDHCHLLPPRECLYLFAKICEAIQHAHQRGIIHRDLKPSNILVTPDGALKVIDFGIAKATTKLLTKKTLLTEFHQFVGTPAYVSPEQADTAGREVDTRSDIYSLGALLYELLTDEPPFNDDTFQKASLAEILRIIRVVEPRKPSTKSNAVTHELDWVVMRALEKDPERRYPSALDFARDIHRYLENKPVEASPPSRLYSLRKFTQRNKASVLATFISLLGLILGLGFASYGLLRARQEAEEAQLQADRANAVIHLVDEMFGSSDPLLMRGSEYSVREMLDEYSQQFEGKLNHHPEVEFSFQKTLATAYQGLGAYEEAERHFRRADQLQASPDLKEKIAWSLRHQGHYQQALDELPIHSEVLQVELYRLLGNIDDAHRLAQKITPTTTRDLTILALIFSEVGDFEMARHLAQKSLTLTQKKHGEKSHHLIRPLNTLALIAAREKHPSQAIQYGNSAKDIAQATLNPDHPARLFAEARAAEFLQLPHPENHQSITTKLLEKVGRQPEALSSLLKLTTSLFEKGEAEQARHLLAKSLNLDLSDLSSGNIVTLEMAGSFIGDIIREDRLQNYLPLVKESLAVAEKLFGNDGAHTIELKRVLAYIYRWEKQYDLAEQLSREALTSCLEKYGNVHGSTIDCHLNHAELLWDQHKKFHLSDAHILQKIGSHFLRTGRLSEAEDLLDRALVIHRKKLGNEHPSTIKTLALLGDLEVAQYWIRQTSRGPLLRESYELSKKIHGSDSLQTAHSIRRLASDYGFLLGPQETITLIRDNMQHMQNPKAIAILQKSLTQLEQNHTRISKSAKNNFQKFKELESTNQATEPLAIENLRQSAYRNFWLGNHDTANSQLTTALHLATESPNLPFEISFQNQLISGWADWRNGRRPLAISKQLSLCKKHLADPRLSSTQRANLIRNYYRPLWDGNQTTEFWSHIDEIEDHISRTLWAPHETTILLPRSSRWFAYTAASPPKPNWQLPDYPFQLLWKRGLAPFTDYFRIPSGTQLPYPTDQLARTSYFRTTFPVSDPTRFRKLKIRLTRWASAVVYLNGIEIIRDNLSPDAIHNTPSIEKEPGGPLRAHIFEFPPTHLLPGNNTLAIAVHRYDHRAHVYFDLQLEGK